MTHRDVDRSRNQGNDHHQGNNQGRNQFFQGASHGQNSSPAYQALGYQAPVHQPSNPQPQVVTTTEFTNYMKANDAILKNMQTNMTSLTNLNLELKNMFGQFMKMNTASSSSSGTLSSNTITKPKKDLKGITTRSGNAYQGPTIPTTSASLPKVVERETEMTKDTVPPPSTNPNPKGRNRRCSKQRIEEFNLDELSPLIVTMADQRTMTQLLQAPTEGYEDAIVVPAFTADNFELKDGLLTVRFDESFSEAWDRLKDLLRAYPHHGFSKLNQLDTFYNALNSKDQDSSNSAAGGNFLDKMPRDYLAIIKSKSKVRYSRNKPVVAKVSTNTSTSGISLDVAELKDMVKALLLDKKSQNQSPAPVKVVEESYVTCGGGGKKPEATKDTMQPTNNGSTEDVQPQVVQSESTSEPVTSPISEPIIAPIFKDISFEISFVDALILMPKFSSTLKALIGNKENLSEMARTLLNEHCSMVLLKKLPKKLGDPGKFLIPSDFPGMAECLALADLDVSINLMPFSVWKRLSLPIFTPTCMILELADRSIYHPVGVAEDVYVKVGSFHFPTDFVVVDFDADPRVPLILGRLFLKIERDLIDVFEGKLTLCVGKEAITFNLDHTSRYSANYSDMMAKRIDVIDMACEEYSQEVLGFSDVISSGNPTPYYDPIISRTSLTLTPFENSDFLLEEVDAFLSIKDDPTSPKVDQSYLDLEGDILLLEAFLNDDPSLPPPTQ
nr:reverse transcriptase domain-containing protein [Tanacetum cinerariifolium]